MRKLLIFIFPLLFINCSKSQSTIGANVNSNIIFAINGDSNSMGVGSNASATAAEKGAQPNVKILNNNTLTIETLNVGLNNDIGGGVVDSLNSNGIEIGLANATDTGRVPSPLYILKGGHSGYKVTDLLPGTPWWNVFTARMDIMVSQLTVNNIPPKFFMLYSEGINDSNFGVTVSSWKTNTILYIQSVRARYGTVPVLMVYVPLGGTFDALAQAYNIAMDQMAVELSDFYPINTDTAPISGFHWTYAGYKVIAYSMVQKIISKYKL